MDANNIKSFWDMQAEKQGKISIEGIANLEEDPKMLKLKVQFEKNKIMNSLNLLKGSRVLDLGTGTGQWAMRFAEIGMRVVGVEYSYKMLKLAQSEVIRRGIKNINFVHMNAQNYISKDPFDLILISGLIIYMNDEELKTLAKNCSKNSVVGSCLLVRDATGIKGRYEINKQYSEELKTEYSAVYRTKSDYISTFEENGFKLINEEDMFPDGSALNKRKETRLRLYKFKKS